MEHEPEALSALEPELRTARREKPFPRRALGTPTVLLLWLLRLYVTVAIPLVVVAFVRALRG
jgi:hypothetical protein